MNRKTWLSDFPTIGEYSGHRVDEYLAAIGDDAEDIDRGMSLGFSLNDLVPGSPWLATTHTFGYTAPTHASGLLEIRPAGHHPPGTDPAGSRVRITLDAVRAAAYPGRGPHNVPVHIIAESSAVGREAAAEFSRRSVIRDGDAAAVRGLPMMTRLPVSEEGLVLTCAVINVGSDGGGAAIDAA